MVMSRSQTAALDRSITSARLGTYLAVAAGDKAWARALYLWDRELAVAFLADIALLEVALRNAMNERMSARWGPQWYARVDVPLDDRSCRQLADAWSRIRGDRTPDRVVAQCMFGFWTGLLDKGDHVGRPPRRVRCDYDVHLWRACLDRAFLGGRAQARADNDKWGRSYAHQVVGRVNILRNRVAHHEPLINGYPLGGQRQRLSAQDGHADCLRLAAMLDRDLHSLLQAHSAVPSILARRPRLGPARVRALRRTSHLSVAPLRRLRRRKALRGGARG